MMNLTKSNSQNTMTTIAFEEEEEIGNEIQSLVWFTHLILHKYVPISHAAAGVM